MDAVILAAIVAGLFGLGGGLLAPMLQKLLNRSSSKAAEKRDLAIAAKSDFDMKSQDINDLRGLLDEYKDYAERLEKRLGDINDRAEELKAFGSNLQARVQELEARNQELSAYACSLEEKVASLTCRLDAISKWLETLPQDIIAKLPQDILT